MFFKSGRRLQHLKMQRYAGHVHLPLLHKAFLAVGSSLATLLNPARGDMLSVLGETTGELFLPRLRERMLLHPEGRRILRDRVRITESNVDLAVLGAMKEGTLGREYTKWLERNGVSPDTREPVRFIDDPELAYIMQRYRECHDFYHLISGNFPTSFSGEVVVKWFEMANMGLPVAALSAVFGPLRMKGKNRERLFRTYVPWALRAGSRARPLIGVYWEERWEQDLGEIRNELGIDEPPVGWEVYKRRGREAREAEKATTSASV